MYVVIVGCGRVGASLATALAAEECDVVVVDRNPAAFALLGAAFNGVTLTGTGIDVEVLRRAGVEKADAFAAVTSSDNVNLMASQIAGALFHVRRVVARINDLQKGDAYAEFGVETVCPTDLGANQFRWLIQEHQFRVVRTLGAGELLVVRLTAGQGLAGRQAGSVEVPGKLRVAAVERGANALVPTPELCFEPGDQLTLTVRCDALDFARSLAEGRERA